MSHQEQSTDSPRFALRLGAWCVAYVVAHFVWSSPSAVPTAQDLASIDPAGQLQLSEAARPDWYLTPAQLEKFNPLEVAQRNAEIETREAAVRERVTTYTRSTQGSNKASVQALSAELDSGQFTEALERWNGIQAATSPRTLARFGTSNAEAIRADLTLLEVLELNQRVARLELQPKGEAGFLWTSPKGAPFEVLAIAGLGALFALFLRRRALLRQGYKSLAAPLGIAFGYAAGPLLALGVWSYTRPNLEFEQYGWALVVIGFSCGFGLPYLARALAHLLGKDLNRDRRSARSSSRKARIVHAMKDLRPGSFAELKRAASQFAAELVTAEVEENPQS